MSVRRQKLLFSIWNMRSRKIYSLQVWPLFCCELHKKNILRCTSTLVLIVKEKCLPVCVGAIKTESPLERHLSHSGTCKFNQPSHFDLSPCQKTAYSILKHTLFTSSLPYPHYRTQIQALRLKHASINSHVPLCEPGPCKPQWGWETPRSVEHMLTPLRWSHESKLPIKKQLQAAAGADSCSH